MRSMPRRNALRPLLLATLIAGVMIPPTGAAGVDATAPHGADAVPTDRSRLRPVAMYQFDPRSLDPPGRWLPTLMRLLDTAGVIRAEDQPVADGVLLGTMLGGMKHRVVVLDCSLARYIPREVHVRRLAIVVEIEAPQRFPEIRQALKQVLGNYGSPDERESGVIDLPGDRQGVRYRFKDWAPWASLSWTADADRFYFALADGALAQWIEHRDDILADPLFQEHRAAAPIEDEQHSLVELYVNLAQFERTAHTLFETGRTAPLLELLDLEDTGHVMVHGRSDSTFLVLDVTRQRGPTLTTQPLTIDHWPAPTGLAKPPSDFHLVAPIEPAALARFVLDLIRLIYEPPDRAAFVEAIDRHQQRTGVNIVDLAGSVGDHLLVASFPRAWLSLPGMSSVYLPLNPDADPNAARRDLATLLQPLAKSLPDQGPPPPQLGIVRHPPSQVSWLDSPMRQLFKAPAWGWLRRETDEALIISFSPQAVLTNRQWLNAQPAAPP